MKASTLSMLVAAGLGIAQMTPMSPMTDCVGTTTSSAPCVLEFRPFMPAQDPPTSTVYNMIMTTYFNIINCDVCSITQIDEYPTATGPFTTKVTSDLLIITRVGCESKTAAITRRDFRGHDEVQEPASTSPPLEKWTLNTMENLTLANAEQHLSDLSVETVAAGLADNISPNNPDLRQQVTVYIRQLISAQLAVYLCNSGFDGDFLCTQSETSDVRYHLSEAGFNPVQVSNILCFCAADGLPLNSTDEDLETQLSTSIYALQSSSEPGANLSRLCDTINLSFGPALQIDNKGIKAYVCSNGTATTLSSAITTSFPSAWTSMGTFSTFATGASGSSINISNSTAWSWSGTAVGTGSSGATSGAGSWGNSSWTQVGTIVNGGFSTATSEGGPWTNSTGGAASATVTGSGWSASGTGINGSWATVATGSAWTTNGTGNFGNGSWSAWSAGGWTWHGTGTAGTATGSQTSWTITGAATATSSGWSTNDTAIIGTGSAGAWSGSGGSWNNTGGVATATESQGSEQAPTVTGLGSNGFWTATMGQGVWSWGGSGSSTTGLLTTAASSAQPAFATTTEVATITGSEHNSIWTATIGQGVWSWNGVGSSITGFLSTATTSAGFWSATGGATSWSATGGASATSIGSAANGYWTAIVGQGGWSWSGSGSLPAGLSATSLGSGGSWFATGGAVATATGTASDGIWTATVREGSWRWIGTGLAPAGGSWVGTGWGVAVTPTATAAASGATGWGFNSTGGSGVASATGWATGGSWTSTAVGSGAPGWAFNETAGSGSAAATGWATGGSWTASGKNTLGSTGSDFNATGAASATGGWGTGGSGTATAGASGASGWGVNATGDSGAGTSTGWATRGSWTLTGGNTLGATGFGFNATLASGVASATGGWATGGSWTATGGSWGTTWGGFSSADDISTFDFGTETFKTITSSGPTTDFWSIVIENASTLTMEPAQR